MPKRLHTLICGVSSVIQLVSEGVAHMHIYIVHPQIMILHKLPRVGPEMLSCEISPDLPVNFVRPDYPFLIFTHDL